MRKYALFSFGLAAALLVALGLVVLSSASLPNSERLFESPYVFLIRQLEFVAGGLVIAVVFALIDYRIWKNYRVMTWVMFGVVFLLLLAVLPPFGHKVNGAYRWIRLGPVNVQPSEFAKIAIVITVAMWMDFIGWKADRFKVGALVPFLLIAAFAGPILRETDLGATVVVVSAGFLMMFFGGTRILYILCAGAIGVSIILGVLAFTPNRVRRLAAWLPSDICGLLGIEQAAEASESAALPAAKHQVINSLIAIKNGGLWGVGMGKSMQKYAYLPEAHTDFVMAIGAEEYGLIFTIGVILLFFLFFGLSVYIGLKSSDRFGRYLAIGMGFIVFFPAMINLGVICEALPTKGMALPFFSYGGTNMLTACFAVGTILSVGIHSYQDKKRTLRGNVILRRSA